MVTRKNLILDIFFGKGKAQMATTIFVVAAMNNSRLHLKCKAGINTMKVTPNGNQFSDWEGKASSQPEALRADIN